MELSVGDIAPDFMIPSVWNESFHLSDEVKNADIMLYFYVVNYGRTCTEYIEVMNERKQEFDKLGVKMVHVNPASVEEHEKWMERTESLYDHLSDTEQKVSKEYGAIVERAESPKIMGFTNREFFLIGKDMKIKYIWRAYWPTDTIPIPELLNTVRELK
jgi:Peroxiredoxin